jgi:hypothetical protein
MCLKTFILSLVLLSRTESPIGIPKKAEEGILGGTKFKKNIFRRKPLKIS